MQNNEIIELSIKNWNSENYKCFFKLDKRTKGDTFQRQKGTHSKCILSKKFSEDAFWMCPLL